MHAEITEKEKDFIGNLYDQYYPFWYKKAYEIVKDDAAARDIINDVFIKLIRKSSMLKSLDKNALITYVVTAIINASKTHMSKINRIEKINYDDFFENVADNISVEATVLKNIDIAVLRKIIFGLDEKERLFVILSYYEGLDDKSIAKEMNMHYNNIRMYRHRLLIKIRKLYIQEGAVIEYAEE